MKLPAVLIAPLLAVAIGSFANTAAQAQRARVFVASYGSDSNSCTFGSPCKTFQQAVNVVSAGGEVTAIDSAGFGPILIQKAVTITSPAGVEASIATASGQTAISIAAGSSDVVTLRGLTLNGAAVGTNAINMTSGGKLAILDCVISNYASYAVVVNQSTAALTTTVLISNSTISDSLAGVILQTGGVGTILATIDHVTLDNNEDAIEVIGSGGNLSGPSITVMISNSTIGTDRQLGIYSIGSQTDANTIVLRDVILGENGYGIYLAGNTYLFLYHISNTFSFGDGAYGVYCDPASRFNFVYTDGTNNLGTLGCSLTTRSPQ